MNSNGHARMMSALLLTLASGCSGSLPRNDPPVQVVQTCPKPPALPDELKAPLPNFRQQIESSLTDFYSSETPPTKPSGSVTSPSVSTN